MEQKVVAPYTTTPTLTTTPAGSGMRWMPSDILEQTCKRVGIASLVFAGIWAWVLVMNNAVWRLFGEPPPQVEQWTSFGNPIAIVGLLGQGGVGLAVDRRADIYALGYVGYWLLTGRTVFEAPTAVAMLMSHVQDEPVPPSRVSELPVPPEFDRVILDCLSKDPDDRPTDAAVLYRRLADCPMPDPWNRDRAVEWWTLHLPELFGRDGEEDWANTTGPIGAVTPALAAEE